MVVAINYGCCYKTVDFGMAASKNGVCITQGKCHKMILFHNFSIIKDYINTNFNIFCHNLNNIGFFMKWKACKNKIRFVMQPLQNPPLCSNTEL